jgi:hypothetical protein
MALDKISGNLKNGTLVKIRNSGYRQGKIVEFRGLLGPGGAPIYRVLVRGKPNPAYIEVREDQLELIPSPVSEKSDSPARGS